MLSLPTITFVIVENRFPEQVKTICNYIRKNVHHAKISVKDDLPLENSKKIYDEFCSQKLHSLFVTPHAIVFQLDGYPIHWSSWDDSFLKYDYIGAPWPDTLAPSHCRVGNGGFSLRSRRLCQALALETWVPLPDDVFICQHAYNKMVELGMRYAPPTVAARFSIEHNVPEENLRPFGFHDLRIHPNYSLNRLIDFKDAS